MKKSLMTLVMVACLFTFLNGEDPVSMRNIATGGVFEGIWEKVYDPIDLYKIDGTYFFTNLADFRLEYDNKFGELADDNKTRFFETLPIGVAFENPFIENLKHSLFVKFSRSKSPLTSNGNSDGGEYENYSTEYTNYNDGYYTRKVITYTKNTDYAEDNRLFDFIWNNNYEMDDYTIGLKFASSCTHDEFNNTQNPNGFLNGHSVDSSFEGYEFGDSSANSFSEFYTMDSDEYFLRTSEEGDFNTDIDKKESNLQISVEYDNDFLVEGSKLRYDFGVDMITGLERDTDDTYSAIYENTDDYGPSMKSLVVTYKNKIEAKENTYYMAVNLKKYNNDSFEKEAGFWETGFKLGFISGEKTDLLKVTNNYLYNSYVNFDELSYLTTSDSYDITETSGDFTGVDFDMHVLYNLPLNRYANFGLGGYYNYSSTHGEYDYKEESNSLFYNQVGEDFDSGDDYRTTSTKSFVATQDEYLTTSEFKLPIAIEFKMPKDHTSNNDGFLLRNFIFRLGSTFSCKAVTKETEYKQGTFLTDLEVSEYGNEHVDEIDHQGNSLVSRDSEVETIVSSKIYSAGLGYRHSDNVNIDLGGFYNYDTDVYFVGLSFTIKR